ncbi:MAG: CRISPR-associated endonuclease Cas2 [Lentisphaerota bacterium]
MWVIIFFDLPVDPADNRKIYADFRKFILRKGFQAVQKSVYIRWTDSAAAADFCRHDIEKNCPPCGQLAIFCVTEKNMRATLFFRDGKSENAPEKPEPFFIF